MVKRLLAGGLMIGLTAGMVALVVTSMPDIRRYRKIRSM
jgi:hypothetical protein